MESCLTYACNEQGDECKTNALKFKTGKGLTRIGEVGYGFATSQCGDYRVENLYGIDCWIMSGDCGGTTASGTCEVLSGS